MKGEKMFDYRKELIEVAAVAIAAVQNIDQGKAKASDLAFEMGSILYDVKAERIKQDQKWGYQDHSPIKWIAILTEEVGEAAQAALKIQFPKEP